MMFGRNEECGLRCVYHGWKYDVTGAVVDTPAEPPNSRLKQKIRIMAFPAVNVTASYGPTWGRTSLIRAAAATWSGISSGGKRQRLDPDPGMQLAAGSRGRDRFSTCADSAWTPRQQRSGKRLAAKRDLRPTFECIRQNFGMSIASRRHLGEGNLYWRVNQFLMPFYTLVPPQSKFPDLSGHAWVPIDDTHTLCVMFSYHPSEPLPARTRELFNEGYGGRETGHASRSALVKKNAAVPFSDYWTKFTPENGFGFDYESQVTTWFSGLPGLWVQDAACQTSIEPIFDRTKEHLGSSDAGIAMTRRLLLEAATAYRDRGIKPVTASDPGAFMVRAVSLTLPENDSWVDFGRQHMMARLGEASGTSCRLEAR